MEATADRKSRLLFVVAMVGVLLAVLALGWFTFVGTSNSRPGAIEATCHGGVASTFDPPHETFKWVPDVPTELYGVVETNHRLFRADRYAFVAEGGQRIPLSIETSPLFPSCPG